MFSGISPADGTVWSVRATQRFEELAFEKTLIVPQPVAMVDGKVALTLLTDKSEDQEETFIHLILLNEGLAVKSIHQRGHGSGDFTS